MTNDDNADDPDEQINNHEPKRMKELTIVTAEGADGGRLAWVAGEPGVRGSGETRWGAVRQMAEYVLDESPEQKIARARVGDEVEYPDGETATVTGKDGNGLTLRGDPAIEGGEPDEFYVTLHDPDARDFELIKHDNGNAGAETRGVLQEAMDIADDRREAYGDPTPNMRHTAALWSAYLGLYDEETALDAADVAQMMTLLKISRHVTGKTDRDNFVDGAGYQRVAAETEGVNGE